MLRCYGMHVYSRLCVVSHHIQGPLNVPVSSWFRQERSLVLFDPWYNTSQNVNSVLRLLDFGGEHHDLPIKIDSAPMIHLSNPSL